MTPQERYIAHMLSQPVAEIVGDRPLAERRSLAFQEQVARWIGNTSAAILTVGVLGLGGIWAVKEGPVRAWAAHAEQAQVAGWMSPVAAQAPLAPLMDAERAWLRHDWNGAAAQWSQWAVAHHDLEAAGWAVRAAAQGADDAHLEQARQAWNAARQQLPSDLHARLPRLANLSPAALAPQLSPAEQAEYQQVWSVLHAPLLYAQHALLWTPDQVVQRLRQHRLATDLQAVSPTDFQDWVGRTRRTLAESDANDAGCDQMGLPCLAPAAWNAVTRSDMAAQQVRHLQAMGLSPEQGWALAQERRLLGQSDHTWTPGAVQRTDVEQRMIQWREAKRVELAQVHTPAQLDRYFQSWTTLPADLQAFFNTPAGSVLFGGMVATQVTWDDRFEGQAGWVRPAHASSKDPVSWAMIQRHLVVQLQGAPSGATPAGVSAARAHAHLIEALRQAGVAELNLDPAIPATPEVVWRLAEQVRAANTSFQSHTGWQGGVLGLKGRLRWSISSEEVVQYSRKGTEQTFGMMTPLYDTTDVPSLNQVAMFTAADGASLGPIAHEWTHALAHVSGEAADRGVTGAEDRAAESLSSPLWVIGSRWMTGEVGQAAWEHLWQSLRSPPLTAAERQANVLERWYAEVTWSGNLRSLALQDLVEVTEGTWVEATSADRWNTQGHTVYYPHQLASQLHAQTEAAHWRDPSVPFTQSSWMRSNLAMTENSAYLNAPAEAVARSAEATYRTEPHMVRNDIVNEIIYPAGQELAYQRQAWKRFYADMTPWWQQQPGPHPAVSSRPTLGQALGQTVSTPSRGASAVLSVRNRP